MKIYDTEKEANAWNGIFITLRKLKNGYAAEKSQGGGCEYFKFKPERVAPAEGQAVRSSDTGRVCYSSGTFSDRGRLFCYETVDGVGKCFLDSFTPVEIIPAGQFAKAVELLERSQGSVDMGSLLERDISALLDEIKAGGD
ncbi:MAG: hypothetical protein ACYTEX_26875 [Planctomycetota bacterium]|jgi:hypothetical protein